MTHPSRHTSSLRASLVGAAVSWLLVAACGSEDPPQDCGDPSMSIVTFQGRSSDVEDEIRTCVDIHAASRSDATATARGLDGSLATSRPGVLPWSNVTFREAVEGCARAGKFLCNYDELRAIAPAAESLGTTTYDEAAIEALSPTSAVTEVPHDFERVNRYDPASGKRPYPESSGSVAYWTSSAEPDDKTVDPSIPYVLGRIVGTRVSGGVLTVAPVLDPQYKHPLLGFRCCINARMRSAFEALPADPDKARESEDMEVPLAPSP